MKRPYDHFKDGHVGGGVDLENSRCTVFGAPSWATKPANAARGQVDAALQKYLEEHPELEGLGGDRLQKIKRSIGIDTLPIFLWVFLWAFLWVFI